MNTPITSSNNSSTNFGSMAKSALGGTMKAGLSIAGAMASEALDIKPGVSAANQNREVKKFPTEYKPNNDTKDEP